MCHLADAQQPEVVQQRQEVLLVGQPLQRKARLDARHVFLPLADDLPEQVEVAVELPARHQQGAQLAIVDAHVAVDQVVRHAAVRDRMLQVVEHHVGVVEIGLGFLGEPVAVVPLAHQRHGFIDVLVEHAVIAAGLQQARHFRLGEADHLVEIRLQADVGADVEAAGDVVHGHRQHAGDEQALDAATAAVGAGLEGGEEVAEEAAAVGGGLVRLGTVLRRLDVGEAVVLVDQHVQRDVVTACIQEQLRELPGDGRRREQPLPRLVGKQVGMPLQRVAQHCVAVGLGLPLRGVELVVDHREVEAQDHVAVALRGRIAPDVGTGEHGLELVAPPAVVVVLQQRHPQRLAEPPRADQEDVALLLQAPQEARLVDVQPPVQADAAEVGLTVGYARVRRSLVHCRNLAAVTLSLPGRGIHGGGVGRRCDRTRRGGRLRPL